MANRLLERACRSIVEEIKEVMPTKKKTTKRASAKKSSSADLEKRVAELEHRLNGSWVHSENFWRRAFGVLGHYVAAYLAIGTGILLLMLASAILAGALAGMISLFS